MTFKTLHELDSSEGTVRLFDASARRQQHRRHDDDDGSSDELILVPRPSSDPNDPLRWPAWRKHGAFAAACLFAFFNNFSGTVLSDSFLPIAEDLGVSVDTASGLISYVVLTLGVANLFWVPAAVCFGKRPVFLVSCAVAFAAAIWAAASPDFASLQAACVVGAFGGGASEALGAAIINDVYFLHERGSKMGVYIIMIAFGSSLGPLCGGFIVQQRGWAWGKWVSAVFLGATLLAIAVLLPETAFDRSPALAPARPVDGVRSPPARAEKPRLAVASDAEAAREKPRSGLALLKPWSPHVRAHASFLALMLRPLPLLAYPACILATIFYSMSLAPTVMVNVLSSSLLIPPPYNFTVGTVGLINIPGMIGQAAGALLGGLCTDALALRRARRADGVFEPESRLPAVLAPLALVLAGLLLFGLGAGAGLAWPALFAGYGLMSVGLTGAAAVGMTYVLDAYFPVAAECLELVNAVKNVVAFAFVKAAVPWVQAVGYGAAFGALAGVFVALNALAVPVWVWGRRMRHYTARRWRLISWEIEAGR